MLTPSALSVAPDVSALAEPHAANAIRTLVDALQQTDGPTRVAAAIALLALAHGAPLQLMAVEAGGVAVEVGTDTALHTDQLGIG